MDIMLVFNQMLVLLILLLVGVLSSKTGIVDKEMTRKLTSFSLLILQTCMIISSMVCSNLDVTPVQVLSVVGMGCIMYAILVVLSLVVPKVFRCGPNDSGIYSFMTIFGNTGFMGIPVCRAIFGDLGALYAALLNIPFNFLAYTLGIAMLSSKGTKIKINWKQIINPPLIATLASIILLCCHFHFPYPVAEAINRLGDMIVPCSMIIIGASLGTQSFRDVFGDIHVYSFAPVRLFVAPVLIWLILHFIIHDSTLLGTMVVTGAMPVAAFATMMSIEYGGNVQMASRTVFVTTVLSVITLPLVCYILPI